MDFSLGDDRRMMADSLSRYFSDTLDWEARQAAAHSEDGFSRDMWSGLTELGVLGMLFSEEAGGYGGSAFDAGAVFSEVGKALATGPFLATLMAGKVLEAAGEADVLADVIAGSRILTFADEPAINADGSVVAPVRATQDGDTWRLSGAKGVVDYLGAADLIVVTAETDAGPSTFLVGSDADGLKRRSYRLVDGGAAGELTLDDTPARLIGEAGGAQDAIDAACAIGLVATVWEAVAIMEVLRDATIDYLGTRKQFGVPIGAFQALKHRMTTVALEIEQARSSAINAAAYFAKEPAVRDRFGSAAKYTIGKVGALTAEEAIQMHGGIGMSWEMPLSHFAKRLIMLDHVLGDEDAHMARYLKLAAS